jgi:hypothetical protein
MENMEQKGTGEDEVWYSTFLYFLVYALLRYPFTNATIDFCMISTLQLEFSSSF